MSFWGTISFHSNIYPSDVLDRIEKSVALSEPSAETKYADDYTIFYSHQRLTEWEDYQKRMNGEVFFGSMIATFSLEATWKITKTQDWRNVINKSFISTLERVRCLKISFWNCDILDVIEDAMTSTIPEDIRGDYHMKTVNINIGEHDLFEGVSDTPIYFGRPLFSFTLGGQGCPFDWDGMREAIANLAEIQSLKKKLEEFSGPLDLCASWG